MVYYLLNSSLILLLGFFWASESVLGKLLMERGAGVFDFPIVLNFGTVIAMLAAGCLKRKPARQAACGRKPYAWMICTALTLVFVPYCILYLSLRQMSPAETSLLTSLTPVFSMILGLALRQMKLRLLSASALASGVIGVSLLILPQLDIGAGSSPPFYYFLMLLVPLSYAASGYFLKAAFNSGATYTQLLLVTNLISGCLFLILNKGIPANIHLDSAGLVLTGIAFNIGAIALMMFISGRTTPFSLSFSNHATLVFSFVMTAIFFNQSFSTVMFVSALLIVLSSILTQVKK
ncbi:TPA: DMT family transporter [Serratia rubidaea]|uniref:DMT family transporter n=1 Tax=Serratia rubidaea TaxID=61652 RepID=UPI0023B033B8|nr:DMT family transporter [Serratia rubidaea]MDK1705062.1 DMT family transporter [Serratia rubidaea]MEB7588355.1 DMT family transporter [Serratia rubidaea]HDJ1439208.1 DMT family transporter [Serratia rubidaea]HDJ1449745.1 DMT family transporter [Serratia rubidaea]HDJ1462274.1 DMT family transporter [Serratia rubidaea]